MGANASVPVFVLGGGSNLLVADGGFDGLVLHVALNGVHMDESAGQERVYEVAAGEDWDRFVQLSVEENCAGLSASPAVPARWVAHPFRM